MIIQISGHHVTTGQALQEYIKGKLESEIKKFFSNVISVHVFIEKHAELFASEIVVNEGVDHQTIAANAEAPDAYVSFDEAVRKMKAQLRKRKQKIIGRSRQHRKDAANAKAAQDEV
jgi:ribosomal subunit interface protein